MSMVSSDTEGRTDHMVEAVGTWRRHNGKSKRNTPVGLLRDLDTIVPAPPLFYHSLVDQVVCYQRDRSGSMPEDSGSLLGQKD